MSVITGVKFRTPGKVYYFAPGAYELKYGDHVIVETARGVEYGQVVLPSRDVPEEELKAPLKEVLRIATPEDEAREAANREKEEGAFAVCQEKIRAHGLEMKLVSAEYTFDNSKLIFYFTADGRVDFRELVKDLAGVFRTRIELRQIGVRDETRILGGIGSCGRPLCCHTYLHEFAPVSIKMAKEQNLSLNPTKISGTCGRLMCCLKNEQETYEYLNRSLPRKGDDATTPDGLSAQVQSVNILRQRVRVIVQLDNDEREMREYPVDEIKFYPRKGRKKSAGEDDFAVDLDAEHEEELRAIEEAEKKEKRASKKGEKKNARSDKGERPEKPEKTEKSERPERSEKTDRRKNERKKEAKGEPKETGERPAAEKRRPRPAPEENAVPEEGEVKEKRRRRRRRHKKPAAEGAAPAGAGTESAGGEE